MVCDDNSAATLLYSYGPMATALCLNYDCAFGGKPYLNETNVCDSNSTFAVETRPIFEPYLGLEGLNKPSVVEGFQMIHDFSWSHPITGKQVRLTYDVEHSDHHLVVNLDQQQSVQMVKCHDDYLSLYFDDHIEAKAFVNMLLWPEGSKPVVITGGREWNCGEVILRKVVNDREKKPLINDRPVNGLIRVLIWTRPSHVSEVLKYAKVSFSVGAFPDGHIKQSVLRGPRALSIRTEVDAMGRKQTSFHPFHVFRDSKYHWKEASANSAPRGFWGFVANAVSSAWHAVQHLASDVENIVDGLAKLILALITGAYDYDNTFNMQTFAWNCNASTNGSAINASMPIALYEGVECTNCYFNLEPQIVFDLHISGYALSSMDLYVQGNVDYSVSGSLNLQESFALNFSMLLGNVTLAPICFTIGPIPFCITTCIPVYGGFDLVANLTSNITAQSQSSGSVKYGVMYTSSEGFHLVSETDLKPFGPNQIPAFDAAVAIAGDVFILPTIVIGVDHLGNANVGVKVFMEVTLNYNKDNSSCSTDGEPAIETTLAFGMQLSLGANISVSLLGINLLQKTWPPNAIWSGKWPIGSFCLSLEECEADGRPKVITNSTVFDGVSFVAHVASKCPNSPPVLFSLQLGEDSQGYWIGSTNGAYSTPTSLVPYQVNCVVQSAYSCTSDGNVARLKGPYGVPPMTNLTFQLDTDVTTVAYSNCSEFNIFPPSITGTAMLAADYSSMTFTPYSSCYPTFTLLRTSALL